MSKLQELSQKFKIKLAQTANQAAPHPVDSNAGPKSGEEAQGRLDLEHLKEIGEDVKVELADALGLQNLVNGLEFTSLRYVNMDGKKSLEWRLKVSPQIAKAFQAGVEKQKANSGPTFAVGRYITQLFNQKLPNVPVLPAQPITIG